MNNKFKRLRLAAERANTNLRYAVSNCSHVIVKVGEMAECKICGYQASQWIYWNYPKNYHKRGVRSRPRRRRSWVGK